MIIPLLLTLAEAFNTYDYTQLEELVESQQYGKALHLIRINEGLYSGTQLPVLDRLIESDPEYRYLRLQVIEHIHGRDSDEAVKALISIAYWQCSVFANPMDLYSLLERFDREPEGESKAGLYLAKAYIAKTLIDYYSSLNLIEYRSAGDDLYMMQDQRNQDIQRAYYIALKALNEAQSAVKGYPGKTREYNVMVRSLNALAQPTH